MQKPLVSILIPVFNREHYVKEAIQSATASTYSNLEVIVVDNASTDQTLSNCKRLADSDGRIKVYSNESNIGPVRNWLRCAELAQGEFVKMIFSDDLVSPDFVDDAVSLINGREDIGFVYSCVEIFNENTRERFYNNESQHSPLIPSHCYLEKIWFDGGALVSPGGTLMRRQDFLRYCKTDFPFVSGVDFASHGAGSDSALLTAIAVNYPFIAHVNKIGNMFRAHRSSITIADQAGQIANWQYAASISVGISSGYAIPLFIHLNVLLWGAIRRGSSRRIFLNKYGLRVNRLFVNCIFACPIATLSKIKVIQKLTRNLLTKRKNRWVTNVS